MSSATSLISQTGYSAVGVSEICSSAGVKKGSFYHFFGSKQDLGLEVIDAYWAWSRDHMWQVFEGEAPFSAKLEVFFRLGSAVHKSKKQQDGCVPGCMLGNLSLELSTQDEDVRIRILQVFEAQTAILAGALDAAMQAREIEPGDANELAGRVLAYMQGVTMMAKIQNDPSVLDTAGRGAAALVGL